VTVTRTAAQCGTDSGYHAHRRRGEATCADCRAAHSAAGRTYKLAAERARRRLAAEFPAAYRQIFKEEQWRLLANP
jgi:hypothetical protein